MAPSAVPRTNPSGQPAAIALGLCAAMAGALMASLRKTARADLPLGAFFALVIVASPLTILGIGPALWALIGGLGVSLLLEREAVVRARRDRPGVVVRIPPANGD